MSPRAVLMRRARAKVVSFPLAARLLEHERRGDALANVRRGEGRRAVSGTLEAGYRNTLYCCQTLNQEYRRIRARWCNNRWCLACNRVRTGRAWNRYMPTLDAWQARHFVTLTVPNVSAADLHATLREMRSSLTRIKGALRKRKTPLVALLKVECTYNAERDDYHPHYHLVVEYGDMGGDLIEGWLKEWTRAERKAQDMRPADSHAVRELFKYFTKLSTGKKPMPAFALTTIFSAMRGLRVFQPIGFKASKALDEEAPIGEDETTWAPNPDRGMAAHEWSQARGDWFDATTGAALSGYTPSEKFRRFAESLGTQPDST